MHVIKSESLNSLNELSLDFGSYIESFTAVLFQSFCSEHWQTTWNKFVNGDYPQADEARMKTQCFKSAWLTVAIHEGFAFPKNYAHLSAAPNTVNGNVVHWTVGRLKSSGLLSRNEIIQIGARNTQRIIPFQVPCYTALASFPYARFSQRTTSATDSITRSGRADISTPITSSLFALY